MSLRPPQQKEIMKKIKKGKRLNPDLNPGAKDEGQWLLQTDFNSTDHLKKKHFLNALKFNMWSNEPIKWPLERI